MFDIGFWELAIIALVALVVIGPERLPKVARVVGMWLGRGRRLISSVKSDIAKEIEAEELKAMVQKEVRGNVVEELVGDAHQTLGQLNRDTQKIMNENRKSYESEETSPELEKNEAPPELEKNDGK